MSDYDIERIAVMLRLLPAPPQGWVQAAQELPRARAGISVLVARAQADAAFRAQVVADLEAALEAEGIDATPSVVAVLRTQLEAD
jgi:hypothetical protein